MPRHERRAARGHTWDSWPCCGAEVVEADWYRGRPRTRGLCPECTTLIKLGKDARARAAGEGIETYKWTGTGHSWPGYHGSYRFKHRRHARPGEAWDAGDTLERRMFELVNTLCKETHERAWRSDAPHVLTCNKRSERISRYGDEKLVTMDRREREALDALDQALRDALESAYHAGKERGQSILLNLAGDEMSIGDFNKQTAEGTE